MIDKSKHFILVVRIRLQKAANFGWECVCESCCKKWKTKVSWLSSYTQNQSNCERCERHWTLFEMLLSRKIYLPVVIIVISNWSACMRMRNMARCLHTDMMVFSRQHKFVKFKLIFVKRHNYILETRLSNKYTLARERANIR